MKTLKLLTAVFVLFFIIALIDYEMRKAKGLVDYDYEKVWNDLSIVGQGSCVIMGLCLLSIVFLTVKSIIRR